MEKIIERMNEIIENAKKENRGLTDVEKNEFEQLERQIEVIRTEKRVKDMKEELRSVPFETNKPAEGFEAITNAMKEKRAITLNGTGAINVIQDIMTAALESNELTKDYSVFYGENAKTSIPVFSTMPATPSGQAEGVTNVSADSTAVFGASDLVPKPFVSLLQISYATAAFNKNFEAQLKKVFSKSFADAILYQSLVGTGTSQFTGVFECSGSTTTALAAGKPTPADLLGIAITAKSKLSNPVIVMSATFLSDILVGTSAKDPITNEILINRTCFGVPIITSGHAPTSTTEDDVMIVVFDKPNYAVAIASELLIIPIRKAGDTNVYYQAELYMNGKPIIAGDVFQLVAKASD